jgi:hypothetical protein
MPRWKYRAIQLNEAHRKDADVDILNDAGAEGWELVGITTNNVAYLKRQVASLTRSSARSRRRQPTNDNGE